jgi:hypothetical protein
VRQLYPLVLAVAAVVVGLAVFELIDVQTFRRLLNLSNVSVPRDGLPSIKSLFYHPVVFAWFTGFVALFLYAAHVVLRRWWLLGAAVVFNVANVLAGRRRAIAGLVAGLIVGFAASSRAAGTIGAALRTWWPIAAGAAVLALAFLPSLLGLVTLTLSHEPVPGQGSPEGRIALYTTSVAIARDNLPFGVGLGRYGSAVSRNPYSPVYADYGLDRIDGLSPENSMFVTDTFWPRILGETGVTGLGALLVFCVTLGIGAWRAVRANIDDALTRAFLLGCWMVFAQALIETLASSMFDSPPRAYLLFGAVGVALSIGRRFSPS